MHIFLCIYIYLYVCEYIYIYIDFTNQGTGQHLIHFLLRFFVFPLYFFFAHARSLFLSLSLPIVLPLVLALTLSVFLSLPLCLALSLSRSLCLALSVSLFFSISLALALSLSRSLSLVPSLAIALVFSSWIRSYILNPIPYTLISLCIQLVHYLYEFSSSRCQRPIVL